MKPLRYYLFKSLHNLAHIPMIFPGEDPAVVIRFHEWTGMLWRESDPERDDWVPQTDVANAAERGRCEVPRGKVAGPWTTRKLESSDQGEWQIQTGWHSLQAGFIAVKHLDGDAVRQLFHQPSNAWKVMMPTPSAVQIVCSHARLDLAPWAFRNSDGHVWIMFLGIAQDEDPLEQNVIYSYSPDGAPAGGSLDLFWEQDWEACPLSPEGMLTDWPVASYDASRLLPVSLRDSNGKVGAWCCPKCGGLANVDVDHWVVTSCCDPHCGDCYRQIPKGNGTVCRTCAKKRQDAHHARQYQEGFKVTVSEYDETLMMCWEREDAEHFYFFTVEELERFCTQHKLELPAWVFGTSKVTLELDANAMLEDALSEHHGDAHSEIPSSEIRDLQNCVDRWLERPGNRVVSYACDTSTIVILPETLEPGEDTVTELAAEESEMANG